MKSNKLLLFLFVISLYGCRPVSMVKSGPWTISYSNGVNISRDGIPIVSEMSAEFSINNQIISSRSYSYRSFTASPLKDKFGRGKEWIIVYSGNDMPLLRQTFRIYKNYILTDISISSNSGVKTNYMAPIVVQHTDSVVNSPRRRSLFVPFDNDAWIRYRSECGTKDTLRSYEVTAIYDAVRRDGMVIGAVEHDKWKNAVDLFDKSETMKVYSGVADKLTRDSKSHGFLYGNKVKSATMMIGYFKDWRKGLETYADANAVVAAPKEWGKAVPMGWNSWGTLQFRVNHTNSTETSDFFAKELTPRSFANADGLTYIGLDSGWSNFSDSELKDFADHCKQCGQVPCIYWTPFADWSKDPERRVPEAEQYRFKDIYLSANGKPQDLDGAYAIDPTHPAVKAMMEKTAEKFRRCGYKYVKMDFMTHGRLEADKWYNKNITTGTEAYNYGMQLLDSIFSDMYINLSISPIFPSQYAQSRRIACDAWNTIDQTEYAMNALSYGWWIGRDYVFNDADHVVLRDATDGENRARITSAVITGLFIVGDDFSVNGDSLAKSRALKYLTNPDVNVIANGKSFMPLNGDNEKAENMFVRQESNGDVYLVIFNYTGTDRTMAFPVSRMPLDSSAHYDITEMWTHGTANMGSTIVVPAKDARIYLFRKNK